MAGEVRVVPANEADWDDLQAVFGTRGSGARCWCQRYKLQPKEAFRDHPPSERARRLRQQTHCGNPKSPDTSGLVAFRDGEPVGWCAVEPRPAFHGMVRNQKVPWEGRDEDKTDESIWAITCLFTRAGHRKAGVSYALAKAAVQHARDKGAKAVEAYPMLTAEGALAEELHVGLKSIYEAAGLSLIATPTKRRAVMRLNF